MGSIYQKLTESDIEKISGKTLREFAQDNIFKPLGMRHTDYLPCHLDEKSGLWVNDQNVVVTDDALITTDDVKAKSSTTKGYYIAPTEKQGKDRKECFEGQVHDPLAREMNLGISGNAGIFTTAEDLAILCAKRHWDVPSDGTYIPTTQATLATCSRLKPMVTPATPEQACSSTRLTTSA